MNTIISKRTSRDTVNKIQGFMKNRLDLITYRTSRGRFDSRIPNSEVLIRWGLAVSLPPMSTVEYNKRDGIIRTSSKGTFRMLLQDVGIPTPKTTRSLSEASRLRYPIVIRPNRHQRGDNFTVVNDTYSLLLHNISSRVDNLYYSSYYPKTTEWRVHIGSGKVLAVQEKIQSDNNRLNWNHTGGSVFRIVNWKDWRLDIVDLAIKTYQVTGLDFCAIDIMADPTNLSLPKAVVCEVNTSVGADDYICSRYAEYFDWLINTKETRKFQIPEGTKARHYVFKHRELQSCDYDFNLI